MYLGYLSDSKFVFLTLFSHKTCTFQEAEAILEDISPSPIQVLGYGVVRVIYMYGA